MQYTQQQSDVFNYGGDRYVSGIYEAQTPQNAYNNYAPATTNYRESQINQIYAPANNISTPAYSPSQPKQTLTRPQTQGPQAGGKDAQNTPDDRFVKYGNSADYKYNLFSCFDQQWNNCLEGNKCGGCPRNECLAHQTIPKDWAN